ncbi:MAG: phytanoyl-CoA dioxygenase family protein, partial [Ferruginibacter sp.]
MIKRIKLLYLLYNFFQKKKLAHNIPVYRKLGIRKKYFSPVSSKDFSKISALNKDEIRNLFDIENSALFKRLDIESKKSILNFEQEGYAILQGYLSDSQVKNVNEEIDKLLNNKEVKFKRNKKIMFAIHKSGLLKSIGNNADLIELLQSLIGGDIKLFQSINFLSGSEQKTHSDSIHMTTYPPGGLLGVWIALEDIQPDNGPLHYYPGSHKLPYYLNADYNNEGNFFLLGPNDYSEYEKMLQQKIEQYNIEKKIFNAKKGDLLIWHANLLHGGEPHLNKEKTRKSMVFHYYNIDCVCFHEITQ